MVVFLHVYAGYVGESVDHLVFCNFFTEMLNFMRENQIIKLAAS